MKTNETRMIANQMMGPFVVIRGPFGMDSRLKGKPDMQAQKSGRL
jgi:hypothetical protein